MNNLYFPLLKNQSIVYLDSAATTQKPQVVIEAMGKFYQTTNASIHRGIYDLSEQASTRYEEARSTVANFINAPNAQSIVFTKNTTESINLVAYAWARKHLKKNDAILVSILEHHSNLIPWQEVCKSIGARLVFLEINDKFVITEEEVEKKWTDQIKFAAITGMSNVTGTKPPLKCIAAKCRTHNIPLLIDAAQLAAHNQIDVQTIDCDFLAFSGHKVYGPTGIGVLYINPRRWDEMDVFMTGGGMISNVSSTSSTWADMPKKFEAGTPPIGEAVGLKAAIEFIQNIGWDKIVEHETKLFQHLLEGLNRIYNPNFSLFTFHFSPLLSFTITNIHPHDIAQILADNSICIRAGHHCCQPLMEALKIPATARISLGIYNTKEDIDKLIKELQKIQTIFE